MKYQSTIKKMFLFLFIICFIISLAFNITQHTRLRIEKNKTENIDAQFISSLNRLKNSIDYKNNTLPNKELLLRNTISTAGESFVLAQFTTYSKNNINLVGVSARLNLFFMECDLNKIDSIYSIKPYIDKLIKNPSNAKISLDIVNYIDSLSISNAHSNK